MKLGLGASLRAGQIAEIFRFIGSSSGSISMASASVTNEMEIPIAPEMKEGMKDAKSLGLSGAFCKR